MLKTLVMGAAAALLMTSNAVADGMPRRAAKAPGVVCCEPSWTGFYIGVGVGGAFVQHDHSARHIFEEKNGYGETTWSETMRLWDHDGGRAHAFGTVTVGYDHQFSGKWVAGIFADYDFGNGRNEHRIHSIGDLYDIHHSEEAKHAWSIGGRLGFLASPSTLLFLSTGWTQVSFDRDIRCTWDGAEHRRSFDKDRDGWFIGAGMETQLGWLHSGLSLRGEYRYTRLDDDNGKHTFAEGYSCECDSTWSRRLEHDHDVDIHSVRVVLAYKFGRREAIAPLK
jgi:outer membrane immunogenic protein